MKTFNDIPKLPGFYKIINIKNKKIYFGETLNLKIRISKHFYELNKNVHKNSRLQKDYNKYSYDKFKVKIIIKENYTKNQLQSIEERFILLYKLKENHYNIISSYSDYLKNNLNKNKKFIKANSDRNSIKIVCINRFNGKKIKVYKSLTEAAKELNLTTSNISKVCKKRLNYLKDYVFVYFNEYDKTKTYKFEHHFNFNAKCTKEHKLNVSKSISKLKGIKVYKYDLKFNLVEEYISKRVAEIQNNFKNEYLRHRAGKLTPLNGYYYLINKL